MRTSKIQIGPAIFIPRLNPSATASTDKQNDSVWAESTGRPSRRPSPSSESAGRRYASEFPQARRPAARYRDESIDPRPHGHGEELHHRAPTQDRHME